MPHIINLSLDRKWKFPSDLQIGKLFPIYKKENITLKWIAAYFANYKICVQGICNMIGLYNDS